jgi:hypothetical protein
MFQTQLHKEVSDAERSEENRVPVFEVPTAMNMTYTFLRAAAPYSSEKARSFAETYGLYLQERILRTSKKPSETDGKVKHRGLSEVHGLTTSEDRAT